MLEEQKKVGRNEPCPCGSGKKYKRCHGADKDASATAEKPAQTDGPDIDQKWLGQLGEVMKRLPKGQMQQLQALMRKAMAGKDVARQMEELQRKLPPQVQEMLANAPANADGSKPKEDMTETQAKLVVEKAVASGRISRKEADNLLGDAKPKSEEAAQKASKFSKLWGNLFKKKT